jgi:hypothetical protein
VESQLFAEVKGSADMTFPMLNRLMGVLVMGILFAGIMAIGPSVCWDAVAHLL